MCIVQVSLEAYVYFESNEICVQNGFAVLFPGSSAW